MRRLLKVIPICIILISIVVGVSIRAINMTIDEFYSSSYISDSSAKAREINTFISQPQLESGEIELEEYKYPIQEVWIEQSTRTEYRWLLFRKTIPTGYRLMLSITETMNLSPNLIMNVGKNTIVCNDSIILYTRVPSIKPDTWLFYGRLQQPFPKSVRCVFKDTQNLYAETSR